MDSNYKDNEDEPVSDSEINVFSKAAMNNAYYISHNIQVRKEKEKLFKIKRFCFKGFHVFPRSTLAWSTQKAKKGEN